MLELISNREIYERVILEMVPEAKRTIWIGTADIKDMYVGRGRRMIPFLEILNQRIDAGVTVRLLHAKEPGPNFRRDFDRYPGLLRGLEQVLCPRVHFKSVIVDGQRAYTGSANLTGAGMGAKHSDKRNFEIGLLTDDPARVRLIMDLFDRIWMGEACVTCSRREFCTETPLNDR